MLSNKISLIVPIYNVENELERCVQSLVKQTYSNIEIILVDDGSPDRCPQMCDKLALHDDRVVVMHKENGGLSSARNAGLRQATGDYIMYVDSDDYLELDACERLMAAATEKTDFVVGVIKEIKGDTISFQRRSKLVSGKTYSAREFIIQSIKGNEFYAPAVLNLYRRDFLVSKGLFFKEGIYFEDHQMLIRLYTCAEQVTYIDYPFYNYIIREGSITSSSNSEKKINDSLQIWEEWYVAIDSIKDQELKCALYGILIRYYLRNCRLRKITKWFIPGMNLKFAMKYSLSNKERLKALLFTVLPRLYVRNS